MTYRDKQGINWKIWEDETLFYATEAQISLVIWVTNYLMFVLETVIR